MSYAFTFPDDLIESRMKSKDAKNSILTPEIIERRKRVAFNLKRLRKHRGIKSQEILADMLDMERSYIGRLESANAPFGSDMEQRFADFYGVDISEFYKPAIQSDFEIELQMLHEDLRKIGGTDRVKRLREMLPLIFTDDKTKDNKIPETSKHKKRSA